MKIEEIDVVELTDDTVPGLRAGQRGTVLFVFDSDPPEYEVEFNALIDVDEFPFRCLKASQIKLVWKALKK